MDGTFDPMYSSNNIWIDTDMNSCLTNNLEDIESDISSLQTGKANLSHVHTEYAPISHTHSDYATTSHKHSASDITSGTLPISKGGTGASTVNGILTNLGNIGKMYSAMPNSRSVAKMEMTTIASLTLPAGTYAIVGNHQWEVNGTGCMYISRLTKSDDSVVYCIVRSDMIGGGGATAAAIVELIETTTIKYETYHQYTAATKAEAIRLSAVKIK
jgi:hypothetical protein